MKKTLIFVTVILAMIGCTNLQSSKQNYPQYVNSIIEISNKEYELINIFSNQGLTLGFDEQGRIFGYSGLNRFFGKVQIKNGVMEVEALASTRMGGSREALIREDQYLSLLKSMTKVEQKNGELVLSNEKGEQLIFITK
jgi:heat shock protein HslJ